MDEYINIFSKYSPTHEYLLAFNSTFTFYIVCKYEIRPQHNQPGGNS